MPAINIELTDAELQMIRDDAARNGKSIRAHAHDQLVSTTTLARALEIGAKVAEVSEELNRRLA